MDCTNNQLLDKVQELLRTWNKQRQPGRATLHQIADELSAWRRAQGAAKLWENPPMMFGATLDDGWGLGIELILKFADAVGCRTELLGLLLPWEQIADRCQEREPDILGLTVLQLDTEEALAELCRHLPGRTKIIAGGPVFKIDDGLASRVGIDFVAKNVWDFLDYLVN